jgi:hypothetical protein
MTPFADMTPNARLGWLLWARSHDWGRRAVMSAAGVISGLCCSVSHRDGRETFARPTFTAPGPMKAWAGY